jgi:hypothetical protein
LWRQAEKLAEKLAQKKSRQRKKVRTVLEGGGNQPSSLGGHQPFLGGGVSNFRRAFIGYFSGCNYEPH